MNAVWAKSSLSFSNGNCVEVTELPGGARLGEFDRFGTQVSR